MGGSRGQPPSLLRFGSRVKGSGGVVSTPTGEGRSSLADGCLRAGGPKAGRPPCTHPRFREEQFAAVHAASPELTRNAGSRAYPGPPAKSACR